MTSLFRREALEAHRQQWMGEVRLLRPVSLSVLCVLLIGIALAAGAWLALGEYTRKAHVTGVLLPRHRSVHVTPTVTKAAAGAVEHVPLSLVGGLPAAITQMQQAGIWVVGLDADAEAGLFDMTVATDPVCLVVGAEGRGLSRLVAQRCDLLVSIPLRGHLSSLNVSVSAAIACYEIVRRRG